MSKFNTPTTRPQGTSPVVTEATPSGVNHYGAPGHARDTRSELFLLAVANMVGENTFHEAAGGRDTRYAGLVRAVTVTDPEWVAAFLGWLRGAANMRSASLVGAAEFAKTRLDAGAHGMSRQVIDSVLQRADEPGEMLAYWTSRYGRAIPKPVKRGIGDAALRLWTEAAAVKWDSPQSAWRMADVMELCHPNDGNAGARRLRPFQGELFPWLLARRHNRPDAATPPEGLTLLRARAELMALPVEQRRAVLSDPERLRAAGMTWEALAGWLQGPMDAQAWTAAIPSMGYMALLRNLRNFDEAGISDDVAEQVAARLADPEQVAKSRQFPFRFLAAYRAVPSLRWGQHLERALQASLANVPALDGRTLIVVDRSPSMFPGGWYSTPTKSDISCADQAGVFGGALALRAAAATLVVYGGTSREIPVLKAGALLRLVDSLGAPISYTDTAGAVRAHYQGHDRVVIVTDEQTATADVGSHVPADVPVYTWNLAGYEHGHGPSGGANRHTFGGLTDQAFRLIPLLEAGRNASWPWENVG